jgi:hypothetical protein
MTSVTIGAGSAYLSVAPPGYRVGVAKSFVLCAEYIYLILEAAFRIALLRVSL